MHFVHLRLHSVRRQFVFCFANFRFVLLAFLLNFCSDFLNSIPFAPQKNRIEIKHRLFVSSFADF